MIKLFSSQLNIFFLCSPQLQLWKGPIAEGH